MNVVFTCGGTGGHINPAIAVANIWKERHPDSKILFVGGNGELEKKLIANAGFALEGTPAAAFARGMSLESIKHNLHAVSRIRLGIKKCKKLLKDFQADIVVGTGGWPSFPAIMAAHQLKIPICVHESNALPGLTTRLTAGWAEKVLVCFPESAQYYKDPKKVEVVGMPVRREFIFTQKDAARKELGLEQKPFVVSAFGSQGARAMNEAVGNLLKMEQDADFPFQHTHAVGRFGMAWMPEYLKNLGVNLEGQKGVAVQEYIYNMPTLMAAADVVISRAGASTCNEIAASGTPCILVPSPNVTDNHQEKNARALEAQGGAVVILEKDCNAQSLMAAVQSLLEDPQRREQMRKSLLRMAVPDSAERVCNIMETLIS